MLWLTYTSVSKIIFSVIRGGFMKVNKKTAAALIVLVLLIAVFCVAYHAFKPQTSEGKKTFTVKIVHSDLTEKTLSFTSNEVYLGELLIKEGIIKGDKGAYGIYITEADGEQAIYEKDKAYWALFINGEYAVTGIDMTPIEDGAQYTLTYTVG